jgi:hypothetical protein
VNKHGGDVTLVELPAVGIRGADLLSKFLADKRLD